MKLRFVAVVAVLSVGLALGFSSIATAQGKAAAPAKDAAISAELIVLHATNDGTGIDPKIGKMPALGKPPHSSYNSYKLLDRSTLSLVKGKPSTTQLPNGRSLVVSLKETREGNKVYVVSTSIQNTPPLDVDAKAGEMFFLAGQTHKGGMLVVGIKVIP